MSFVKGSKTGDFLQMMYGDMMPEEMEYILTLFERAVAARTKGERHLPAGTPVLGKAPYHVYYAIFREEILACLWEFETIP